MGEGSLRKRKEQDNRKEDGQSIQSQEPQSMNLKKQVNANTHSLNMHMKGWHRETVRMYLWRCILLQKLKLLLFATAY